MRILRGRLVWVAVALALAACYPATRPERFTSEPLVPTIPPPAALPPIIALAARTTVAVVAAPPPSPTSSTTPPPQIPLPSLVPSATPLPQLPLPTPTGTLAAPTAPRVAASPSNTPAAARSVGGTLTPSASAPAATRTAAPSVTPVKSAGAGSAWGLPASERGRVGVGATVLGSIDYDWGKASPGWWLNWSILPRPPLRPEIPFARVIATNAERFYPGLAEIRTTAAANPGNLWLIGNEPDVAWQGNATAEQYATTYHDLYTALKEADPSARIAIGGVSQPTPLRLAYLDRILTVYKTRYGTDMPVDIWNVHAFILREELNSWGVEVPLGMGVTQGRLYEVDNHADLSIFKQQIVDFRRWMAERGQRDKPLIVSEYGILMPEDYGFPSDLVKQFMTATFDYFLTAKDTALGYSADENRLVQAFCWYSTSDTVYSTSNLFDPATRAVTPLGETFKQYVMGLK